MAEDFSNPFRRLPSVDRLLQHPDLKAWVQATARPIAVESVRRVLEEARAGVARDGAPPPIDQLAARVLAAIAARDARSLHPLINATGVILHTNLGRAPVSRAAAAAMAAVAAGYSNLEFDLDTGERGSRAVHVEALLQRLTGAETGFVVNNNASAVLLVLSALAPGREVIVSRGQAVEIGGGFRIPDVLRQSGARLVEVGTTNRTYAADYERAITPDTAALLRVHSSNFRIVGFTAEPTVTEMAALARQTGVPLIDDLGSGALLDTTQYGLGKEPMVQESVAAGASVVCFSGDKLLGGPQAGVVVGKRDVLERIARHPLARAVRIDKAGLAGLQETLHHYDRDEATTRIPVWQMIATSESELRERAERLLAGLTAPGFSLTRTRSTVGGGSLPAEEQPSWAIAIGGVDDGPDPTARDVLHFLRSMKPPMIGHIVGNRVLLDLRTVLPEQDGDLLEGLRAVRAYMVSSSH